MEMEQRLLDMRDAHQSLISAINGIVGDITSENVDIREIAAQTCFLLRRSMVHYQVGVELVEEIRIHNADLKRKSTDLNVQLSKLSIHKKNVKELIDKEVRRYTHSFKYRADYDRSQPRHIELRSPCLSRDGIAGCSGSDS
jgi:hypothetical protein